MSVVRETRVHPNGGSPPTNLGPGETRAAYGNRQLHPLWTPPSHRDTQPSPSWTARQPRGKPAVFPTRFECLHLNRRGMDVAGIRPLLPSDTALAEERQQPHHHPGHQATRKGSDIWPGLRERLQGAVERGQGRAPRRGGHEKWTEEPRRRRLLPLFTEDKPKEATSARWRQRRLNATDSTRGEKP